MPRKKTPTYAKPQEYDIGNGVTVTITYPVGHRPKMQHLDTVVIVGDHICAPLTSVPQPLEPLFEARAKRSPVERGGNFEVDENDPQYIAFKQRLAAGRGSEPAPADYSPPVITNADINANFEQQVRAETGIDISVPDVSTALKLASG